MNVASLSYTLELLLAELAVGTLAVVTLFNARGSVTLGYVKSCAIMVVALAALALWTALIGVSPQDEIEGYELSTNWIAPFRVTLAVFATLATAFLFASFTERRRTILCTSVLGSLAGTTTLATFTGVLTTPTWAYISVFASTLVSAAVLGGALAAMTWGHWYLTNSGLAKEPLEQMSLWLLAALAVQLTLITAALVAPIHEGPFTDSAAGIELRTNPAFWLRISVGVIFPAFLAWLAWRAATIRGMMSATGLLYIALGAVLAGAVLARGLLFSTGFVV